jgi:hypothetical protein
MEDFSENIPQEAPENFEAVVMAKIAVLSYGRESASSRAETFMCWLFGVFSALIGLGVLLFLNKDAMLRYIEGSERLSTVMEILAPVSAFAAKFSSDATLFVSDAVNSAAPYFYSARYLLLGMAFALGLTQYILYKKGKKGKVEV